MSDVELGVKAVMMACIDRSTCQKRKVACVLVSRNGRVVSYGVNTCQPEGGVCHRLGLVQSKENYDVNSNCNWIHAEIDAIKNLPDGYKPFMAYLYGHDFFCGECEKALEAKGVEIFNIVKEL